MSIITTAKFNIEPKSDYQALLNSEFGWKETGKKINPFGFDIRVFERSEDDAKAEEKHADDLQKEFLQTIGSNGRKLVAQRKYYRSIGLDC